MLDCFLHFPYEYFRKIMFLKIITAQQLNRTKAMLIMSSRAAQCYRQQAASLRRDINLITPSLWASKEDPGSSHRRTPIKRIDEGAEKKPVWKKSPHESSKLDGKITKRIWKSVARGKRLIRVQNLQGSCSWKVMPGIVRRDCFILEFMSVLVLHESLLVNEIKVCL